MRNSAWFLMFCALSVSGCGYNSMQTQDEQAKSAWSEVLNQYQRRADLIPNLVATVQGLRRAGATGSVGRDGGPRQGGFDSGDQGAGERSGGLQEVSGGPGRTLERLVAPVGGDRRITRS